MKPQANEHNCNRCLCVGCQVYGHCNEEKREKLFCATKKSVCSMDQSKMCICGSCPVYAEHELSGAYFCINELE